MLRSTLAFSYAKKFFFLYSVVRLRKYCTFCIRPHQIRCLVKNAVKKDSFLCIDVLACLKCRIYVSFSGFKQNKASFAPPSLCNPSNSFSFVKLVSQFFTKLNAVLCYSQNEMYLISLHEKNYEERINKLPNIAEELRKKALVNI